METPFVSGIPLAPDDENVPMLVWEPDPVLAATLESIFINVKMDRFYSDTIPFMQYFKNSPDTTVIMNRAATVRDLYNANDFWVLTAVGGYEAEPSKDHDGEANWYIGANYRDFNFFANETFEDIQREDWYNIYGANSPTHIFAVAKTDLRAIHPERKIRASHELIHNLAGGHIKPWRRNYGIMSTLTMVNDVKATSLLVAGYRERYRPETSLSFEGIVIHDVAVQVFTNFIKPGG